MVQDDIQPNVILVEDDTDLRESIAEYLTLSGVAVTGVGSCLECYTALKGATFNVAVVDISLPDQSGFVLTEYLRINSNLSIIILTARETLEDRINGYSSGADLYLVKPVDARELLAAIKSLAKRQHLEQKTPLTLSKGGTWQLHRDSWTLDAPDGSNVELTAKEFRFLEALIKIPEKPVGRDHLIHLLGYSDDEYASRAMDSLVRRIRRKIEECTHLPSPIKTVHSIGYCFTSSAVIC
jgi:DNA-binding response OmpR family regulator